MLKEMQSSESMVHCVRAIPQILNLRLYFNHFNYFLTSDWKGHCLSVRLSNAWIMTKWKKDLSRFFMII